MSSPTGEVLAVVPARGGSRGVPGKNLAVVGGRSLVARAVDAARGSRGCTRVVVSTDAPEIAAAAAAAGAEVPFLRPEELARDDTPGIAPLLHAVRWLEEHEGYRPDWVVLLQPTSPLRTAADVDGALALAVERRADSVVSVTAARSHPYWVQTMDAQGRLRAFVTPATSVVRRQDLPPAYALNGAVYVVRREVLVSQEKLYTEQTWGYVMPARRSLDVDTGWDLQLANLVLESGADDDGG